MKYYCTLVLFGIILAAISFTYPDPDDASVIAYHSQGENTNIQAKYSWYNSGYDLILSLLNRTLFQNSERNLRLSSYWINILSLLTVLWISQRLIAERFGKPTEASYFFCLALLIIPELIFWGLDITEGICSLAFMITAYYVLTRPGAADNIYRLAVASFLLGIGISVRWELGLFSIYVGIDLLINRHFPARSLILVVLFSIVGLFASLLLSGYGINNILAMVQGGHSYTARTDYSKLSLIGANLSLATPAAVLLFGLGLYQSYKTKLYAELLILLVVMGGYLLILNGVALPKTFLPVLFVILIILFQGFLLLIQLIGTSKVLGGLALTVALAPWLVGVVIFSNQTAWGPAFEMDETKVVAQDSQIRNPDKRMKDINYKLSLGGGFAISTPEGPRPLWGYAYVIFHDWKKLNEKLEQERELVVKKLMERGFTRKILLTDNRNSLNVVTLNRFGYRTNDSMSLSERCFINPTLADSIYLRILPKEIPADYFRSFPHTEAVTLSVTYSSLITRLVGDYQEVKRLGPFTAALIEE